MTCDQFIDRGHEQTHRSGRHQFRKLGAHFDAQGTTLVKPEQCVLHKLLRQPDPDMERRLESVTVAIDAEPFTAGVAIAALIVATLTASVCCITELNRADLGHLGIDFGHTGGGLLNPSTAHQTHFNAATARSGGATRD